MTGAVVNAVDARGADRLTDLSPGELAPFHPLLAASEPDLSVDASLAARDLPGGTAPRRVNLALSEADSHRRRATHLAGHPTRPTSLDRALWRSSSNVLGPRPESAPTTRCH